MSNFRKGSRRIITSEILKAPDKTPSHHEISSVCVMTKTTASNLTLWHRMTNQTSLKSWIIVILFTIIVIRCVKNKMTSMKKDKLLNGKSFSLSILSHSPWIVYIYYIQRKNKLFFPFSCTYVCYYRKILRKITKNCTCRYEAIWNIQPNIYLMLNCFSCWCHSQIIFHLLLTRMCYTQSTPAPG